MSAYPTIAARGGEMPDPRKARAGRAGRASQLRIIGGHWRGRKLTFTAAEGLRPTPDRVRETLFNWLAAEVRGARCLDLFCGSGALGLEALSRGAKYCDFVDSHGASLRQVAAHIDTLGAGKQATCHSREAQAVLADATLPWDIVFIDPPFGRDLAQPVCRALDSRQLLAPGARIYLETGREEEELDLPAHWQLHRDKQAGAVRYRLFHCDA